MRVKVNIVGAVFVLCVVSATVVTHACAQNTYPWPQTGNVGIGTPNPTATLDVEGGASGQVQQNLLGGLSSAWSALALGRTSPDAYLVVSAGSDQWIKGTVAGDAGLRTQGGKLLIDTSGGVSLPALTVLGGNGNVGIGTASPNAPLQVGGSWTGFGTGNYTINRPAGALVSTPAGPDGSVVTGLLIDSAPVDAWNQGIAIEMGLSNTGYGHYTSRIVHYGYAAATVGSRLQIQTHSNSADVWNTGLFLNELGNVGIGTTSPQYALDVNGPMRAAGGIVFLNGVQTEAYTGTTCGGDYAESVDVTGDRKHYEPGDLLVIDPDAPGKFLKSAEPYSTLVAGIYSTKPGTVGRRQLTPKSPDEVPMAMVGIVPTKVTAENGAIKTGDFLVSSSKTGYAMKGTDRSKLTGAVIGKALGSLDSGTGTIEVLVTLQ